MTSSEHNGGVGVLKHAMRVVDEEDVPGARRSKTARSTSSTGERMTSSHSASISRSRERVDRDQPRPQTRGPRSPVSGEPRRVARADLEVGRRAQVGGERVERDAVEAGDEVVQPRRLLG